MAFEVKPWGEVGSSSRCRCSDDVRIVGTLVCGGGGACACGRGRGRGGLSLDYHSARPLQFLKFLFQDEGEEME